MDRASILLPSPPKAIEEKFLPPNDKTTTAENFSSHGFKHTMSRVDDAKLKEKTTVRLSLRVMRTVAVYLVERVPSGFSLLYAVRVVHVS